MALDDVLDQQEIDALLEASKGSSVQSAANIPVEMYEFSEDNKIIRGKLPSLEIINEKLENEIRLALYEMYKRKFEVNFHTLEYFKFGEYIASLQQPTAIVKVSLAPLPGVAFIVISAEFILSLVDIFYGGNGKITLSQDKKSFSSSEVRIVDVLAEQIIKRIVLSWEQTYKISGKKLSFETNPEHVGQYVGTEKVLVNTFKVSFEDNEGDICIVYPEEMLNPIQALLTNRVATKKTTKDEIWQTTLQEDILKANVEINCSIAKIHLKLKAILALKTGDFLQIEMNDLVPMGVSGHTLFNCKFGTSKDKYALRIVSHTGEN